MKRPNAARTPLASDCWRRTAGGGPLASAATTAAEAEAGGTQTDEREGRGLGNC